MVQRSGGGEKTVQSEVGVQRDGEERQKVGHSRGPFITRTACIGRCHRSASSSVANEACQRFCILRLRLCARGCTRFLPVDFVLLVIWEAQCALLSPPSSFHLCGLCSLRSLGTFTNGCQIMIDKVHFSLPSLASLPTSSFARISLLWESKMTPVLRSCHAAPSWIRRTGT